MGGKVIVGSRQLAGSVNAGVDGCVGWYPSGWMTRCIDRAMYAWVDGRMDG